MTLSNTQKNALQQICDAIIESVKAAGAMGAPGGILYAALMTQGCTLNQFDSIMGALVRLGKLTKQGQCYFANPSI